MTKVSAGISIENLVLFSKVLREAGIKAGIEETMDATRVIELLGLEDRETVRTALCSVYAKSKSEQLRFYNAFDAFFVGAHTRRKQEECKREAEEETAQRMREAEDELRYDGKPLELSRGLKTAYANLSRPEREQLQKYLSFSTDNLRSSPFNERFIQKIIEQRLMLDDVPAAAGSSIDQVPAALPDLLNKNLSDITDEEVPHVIALISLLVKRINGEISREYRRSGKSGRLDFRKTIHNSLRTGGSFYHLRYKNRRRSKKKIIILCDVSGSMLKFTQFAIRFIKSMSDVADRSEAFLFSEGIHRISPFVLKNMKSFENGVKESGLWGKGTDIGRAFEELLRIRPAPVGGSSVLIILSDTKTMSIKTAEAQLQKISKRVSRVLWMNPVSENRWVNMKSVAAFQPYCRMLDCSTLNNLAAACAKLAGGKL